MDIRQLRYFVRIVELESISAAAKALFVAQPSLSQHVANLEHELGARLLVRGAQGVRMTPQGESLYRNARAILRQVDDAVSDIRTGQTAPAGTVSVGLPISTNRMVGLALVRAVRERHPQVMLNIVEGVTSHLTALGEKQLLDIAVLTEVRPGTGLQGVQVAEEEIVFLAAADAVPPELDGITLAECAAHDMVLPSFPNSVRVQFESACLARGLPVRVIAESASAALMMGVVRAGLAATLLPWAAVLPEGEGAATRWLPITDFPLRRRLYLCLSRAAEMSRASLAVHEVLRELIHASIDSGQWRRTTHGSAANAAP